MICTARRSQSNDKTFQSEKVLRSATTRQRDGVPKTVQRQIPRNISATSLCFFHRMRRNATTDRALLQTAASDCAITTCADTGSLTIWLPPHTRRRKMVVRGDSFSSRMKPRIGNRTRSKTYRRKRATFSAQSSGANVAIESSLGVIEAREGHRVDHQPPSSDEVVEWCAATIIE